MGRDTKEGEKKKYKEYRNSTTDKAIVVVATGRTLKDIEIHGPISHKIYRPATQEYIVEHQGPFMADPLNTKYIFLRVNLNTADKFLIKEFKDIVRVSKESPMSKKLKRNRIDVSERIKIEQRVRELYFQGLKPVEIKDALFDEGLVNKNANPFTVLRRVHRYLKKN